MQNANGHSDVSRCGHNEAMLLVIASVLLGAHSNNCSQSSSGHDKNGDCMLDYVLRYKVYLRTFPPVCH